MSAHKGWVERAATALILFGIFCLCQPFFFGLYRYGFTILLIGTVMFTVASHWSPPRQEGGS